MMSRKTSLLTFLAGAAVGFASWAGTAGAQQGPPSSDGSLDKNVVAEVNGVLITRQQLAEELIARKGRSQLDALVKRTLIEQAAQKRGISVTDKEVQAEVLQQMRAAAASNLADFEQSMLRPMKTNLLEWREDVVRPQLLIRKMAEAQLNVTDEDLRREFACHYGPKVVCRIITFKDSRIAKKVFTEIEGKPENFIRQAKMQENVNLAASAGMIEPFGRHSTHDILEKRAFEMKEGEVSEVLHTPEGGYVILMVEHHLPARSDLTFEQVKDNLKHVALERKRKTEMPKIVKQFELEAAGKIKIYLGNELTDAIQRAEKVFEPQKK
jgi:parvulin-like peptidyl-prolyl isomerase